MVDCAEWYIAGVALSLRATVLAIYGRFESGQFDRRELVGLRAVARELAELSTSVPHGCDRELRDATIALAVTLSALLNVAQDEGHDANTVYQAECDAAMKRLAAAIDRMLKRPADTEVESSVLLSDTLRTLIRPRKA